MFIRDSKEQTDIRYYLCSLPFDVSLFAKCVRNHWGIENTCRWSLDVTYNEDRLKEQIVRLGLWHVNGDLRRRK
jgi:predicted transposase YbfD/YdcC